MKFRQFVMAAVVLGNVCGVSSPTSATILININSTSKVSYQTANYYLDAGEHSGVTDRPFGTEASVELGSPIDVTTFAQSPSPYSDLYASLRGIYSSHGETAGSFELSFEQQQLGADSGKPANGAYTQGQVWFRVTEEVPYTLSGSFGPEGDIVPVAHWTVRLSEFTTAGGQKLFEQWESVYQDINGIYAGLDLPLTLGELQDASGQLYYTGRLEGNTSGILRPGYNYGFSVVTDLDTGAIAGLDMSLWTGNVTLQIGEAVVLAADFDDDGDVDGDDFLLWQASFGVDAAGDADGDGDTDGDDFLIWQSEFGSGSGSASGIVPEPASIVLLLVIAAAGVLSRRRGISQPSR